MSMSSYDELLKQVESLKLENSHLKRELQDNSSHLTKLENEASTMKDVLSHLHTSMSEDLDTNIQLERAYQGTTDAGTGTSTDALDQNSNSSNDESTTEQNWLTTHHNVPLLETSHLETPKGAIEGGGGERGGGSQKSPSNSPTGSPSKRRSSEREREMYSIIQELDQERTSILHEIEAEEKHRKWYYEQLESLTRKIETLPLTEQYNLQTDMARRQLEYEAQRLRELMKENLGSAEQIAQRHEARLQRIRLIEQEMLCMQQRHHEQLEQQKRDSGTCDHLESERDGVIVVDAATNTLVSGDCESESLAADQGGHPQLNNQNFSALYHGAWPIAQDGRGLGEGSLTALGQQDTASVMSFHSSHASSTGSRRVSNQQLGTKVEMVYSLLSMLGTHDKDDMSRTLLAMSSSQDSCIAMRQSGCLPLLIQLLHGSDKESGLLGNTRGSKAARARAAAALHNLVHSHPDDKRGRREARVLRLLEQIRAHCDQLRDSDDEEDGRKSQGSHAADIDHHPGPAIAALMKLSFDEEHRHAICTLGGLQAIAELLQVDHDVNDNTTEQYNITMRRYACMALTNLTFGDGTNKALLCSMKACMCALVAQLHSANEDLRQVAASVLRNLSWRADLASKKTLREVGAVVALMQAAMEVKKESTLKSILSALWNLSAHCSENKADICAVEGSLAFLVSTLTYKSPSKTLAIIENGGGILRNISSHIAVREDYRQILRQHGCLQILLKHLRSPSLTIVSNACGTLWNLSARCQEDQQSLWDMGAVSMLRNLVHSKHKMISMGSAAALKNLLAAKPAMVNLESDRFAKSNMPSLHVRKQRALEAEIDQNLAETCDNVESPQGSPTEVRKHDSHEPQRFLFGDNCGIYQVGDQEHRRSMMRGSFGRNLSADASTLLDSRLRSPSRPVSRSASQDSVGSVGSVHSDISHDRSRVQNVLAKSSKLLQERQNMNLDRRRDLSLQRFNSSADSQKSSDSGHSGPGSASRIVQVMQEVALHAGLETGSYESNSEDNTPPAMRRAQTNQASARRIPSGMFSRVQTALYRGEEATEGSAFTTPQHNQEGLNNHQTDNRNLPFTRRMETIHINDTDSESQEDQPINYSLKYSEPTPRNNQASQGQGPGFVKPIPKVGNYVAGLMYSSQQKVPNVSACNVAGYDAKPSNVSGDMDMDQYSGYAETDLDNMDQPTNYSIRFAEHTDECHFGDQPINYSTRFQEPESNCADCKLEEARRTNEIIEDQVVGINEDTVRTFYTEGTPLNYLSTATSMNDLTKAAAKDDKNAGNIVVAQATRYPESDHQSTSMSGSTERHTGSTVVPVKTADVANIQNNNVPATKSPPTDSTVPLYYNDSGSAHSPSEKPTKYCEEGTPTCFSRVSSLSSLHSTDAQDHPNNNIRQQETAGLQSIDENDCLDITHNADVTLRPSQVRDESYDSANTTLGSQGGESTTSSHPKSVTFDENNQVQETPLMFSRCSSLGSLSSFDAHSVHSSVVSEYSRRASEVVSPSDLPDSPSDTMPPSPHHRKSPIKFDLNESEATELNEANITQIENPAAKKSALPRSVHATPQSQRSAPVGFSQTPPLPPPKPEVFMDSTQTYATESSPADFSCATSLSALTIDDEPEIKKEPGLRRVPVGQEDDSPSIPLLQMTEQDQENETAVNLLDGDSSGSEGDEDILAECINLAMPNNSKKKMKRSTSDGNLKKKAGITKINNLVQTPPRSRLPSKIPNSFSGRPQITSTPRMNASYHGSIPHQDDIFTCGIDSPKNFATEGTPLNFSNATSLSDLSESNIDATPERTVRPLGHKTPKSTERPTSAADDKSDISSVSEDCEDLLSEAIEAAMPKISSKSKKQSMVMDRTAEGAEKKDRGRFQSPNFQPKKNIDYQPGQARSQVTHPGSQNNASGDSVKVYAMEGTPINFSTATSLSDLTIESIDGFQEKPKQVQDDVPAQGGDDSVFHHAGHMDSPKLYGMEGTPMSFSCNDSLSSLSCDEDADLDGAKKHLRMQGEGQDPTSPHGLTPPGMSPPGQGRPLSARKPGSGLSSPGLPKSKAFARVQRSLQYGKSPGASPPTSAPDTPPKENEDHTQNYAVEGTPTCFSRNSSLSSLNSDDHEALANTSGGSDPDQAEAKVPVKDHNASFKVEDTSVCFSHNSSLSSLSVESLSFEPTPSETALLEECINAAMPKSKPGKGKGGKGSRLPRSSPTGGASVEQEVRKKSPKSDSPKSENGSKNELMPQSRNDLANTITESHIEMSHDSNKSPSEGRVGWRHSPTQDNDSLPKEQKDVHNQEKVLETSGREDSSHTDGVSLNNETSDANQVDLMVNSSGEPFDNKQEEEIEMEANKLALLSLQTGESAGDTEDEEELEKSDTVKQEECIVTKEELEPTKEEHDDSLDLGCKPLEQPMVISVGDITCEEFPDMGISLVSNITTPDEEHRNLVLGSGYSLDTTIRPPEEVDTMDTGDNKFDDEDSFDSVSQDGQDDDEGFHYMSAEEERALEENANIILTEISFSKDLSYSTCDDDLFIEHETLSLVSNDYASDSASEASLCLSSSSKTLSEQASETSTMSRPSSSHSTKMPVKIARPRIVKPVVGQTTKQEQNDGPKGIRGRRKALYSKASTSQVKAQTPVANVKSIRGGSATQRNTAAVNGGTTKVATKPSVSGKATPGQAVKKTPAKAVQPRTPSVGGTPKSASTSTSKSISPNSAKGSSPPQQNQVSPRTPKTSKLATPKSGIPGKVGTSGIPRSSAVKPKPNNAKADSTTVEVERPKPPIKQGTFTKDSPTQNAPEISPTYSHKIDLNANKANISNQDDNIIDSLETTPTRTEVLIKKDNTPSLGMKRNVASSNLLGRSSASNLPRTGNKTNLTKAASGTSLAKAGSGSSLNKTASGSSLNKTSSGSSLSKTPSSSSIPKTGSTGSLKSTGKANSIKKSDSQVSLKKLSVGGRPVTPTRKNSSGSTSGASTASPTPAGKKPIPGKKPAVSKIASLWKKEEKEDADQETKKFEPKGRTGLARTPMKAGPNKAQLGSPSSTSGSDVTPPKSLAGRKTPTQVVNEKGKTLEHSESLPAESTNQKEGIPRSSTYDKLPAESEETSGDADENEFSFSVQSSQPKNLWRRTYTITNESSGATGTYTISTEGSATSGSDREDNSSGSTLSLPLNGSDQPKQNGSLWKRHTMAAEPPLARDSTVIQSKIGEKVKKSLWRRNRDAAKFDSKGSKIPSPHKKSPDGQWCEVQWSGVWVQQPDPPGTSSPSQLSKTNSPAKRTFAGLLGGRKSQPNGVAGKGSPQKSSQNEDVKGEAVQSAIDDAPKTVPATSPTKYTTGSDIRINSPNAAIVPPFNYTPSTPASSGQKAAVQNGTVNSKPLSEVALKNNINTSSSSSSPGSSPSKATTKTEMLIARRRQYMNSLKQEDSSEADDPKKGGSCLVTTV